MDQASDRIYHIYGEIPKAETYYSMTDEEKDLELKKSITRLHYLVYKITLPDAKTE